MSTSQLTWLHRAPSKGCDELHMEFTWGIWPYRIVVYSDCAIVTKFSGSSIRTARLNRKDGESVSALTERARAEVVAWDRDATEGTPYSWESQVPSL
ncbi:hypothetical protein ONA92_18350 [Mycobacteroides salmoniphilum]|uniref:hypothetical protein n=1 Tax=Mycobacteroides salmoniphilum TaxID=404941 RepID=UPI003567EFD1